ncbi:MAG: nucleoside hydrolase [Kiritimatiellia bacterium]
MKKVFLDTDIGTDPDDSLCLTYLLCQPRCNLLGITTVGRESGTRARLAGIFTRHFGAPAIPIAAGADQPFFSTPYWRGHELGQAGVLEKWPVETSFAPSMAVPLMREAIRAHPGEVSLVAVGPLTNVALLAVSDPETALMVKELVIMGGKYDQDPDSPQTECNTMLDPVSAGAVFQHRWPEVRVISLDTTGGKSITMAQMEENLDREKFAPLYAFAEARHGRGNAKGIGGHDPLTAATLFAPDLLTFKRGRTRIRLSDHDPARGTPLEGDSITGWTTFEPAEDGPHSVAAHEDADAARRAFHKHLFEVLCG